MLQKIPQSGDVVVAERKKISIVEMLGKRISKVKLETLAPLREEEKQP
jgi:CBS domain containing-hemolysin-like protein